MSLSSESASVIDPERKRKAQEIHRRVMLGMGFFMVAIGLIAAYLALGPGGDLPSWMYGRLGARAERAAFVPRHAAVQWNQWGSEPFARARKTGRLVLLSLTKRDCRACRAMDETTFADPRVADLVSRSFVAVRVDGDKRPDLARLYLAGGWPTSAALLPSGAVVSGITFAEPDRFLAWAQALLARRQTAIMSR